MVHRKKWRSLLVYYRKRILRFGTSCRRRIFEYVLYQMLRDSIDDVQPDTAHLRSGERVYGIIGWVNGHRFVIDSFIIYRNKNSKKIINGHSINKLWEQQRRGYELYHKDQLTLSEALLILQNQSNQ